MLFSFRRCVEWHSLYFFKTFDLSGSFHTTWKYALVFRPIGISQCGGSDHNVRYFRYWRSVARWHPILTRDKKGKHLEFKVSLLSISVQMICHVYSFGNRHKLKRPAQEVPKCLESDLERTANEDLICCVKSCISWCYLRIMFTGSCKNFKYYSISQFAFPKTSGIS